MIDPDWSDKINVLKTQSDHRVELSKNRLYFLIPYHDITNRLARVNVTDDRGDSRSIRQKRSAIYKPDRVEIISNYKNNAGHKVSTVSSVVNKRNDHNVTGVRGEVIDSVARPSSRINVFANTIVDAVKRVSRFVSFPFKSSIDMEHSQPSKTMATQSTDINSTLFLLDVFIRKITGQKYISTVDRSFQSTSIIPLSSTELGLFKASISLSTCFFSCVSLSILSLSLPILCSGFIICLGPGSLRNTCSSSVTFCSNDIILLS